jgi:putative membrane protein insertion efficiency factor
VSSENASSGSRRRAGLPARLLLLALEAYRALLSPLLGGHCRFWPSCSVYAQEAIEKHGAWRGVRLTLLRLARCQPFARGGIDPVP